MQCLVYILITDAKTSISPMHLQHISRCMGIILSLPGHATVRDSNLLSLVFRLPEGIPAPP